MIICSQKRRQKKTEIVDERAREREKNGELCVMSVVAGNKHQEINHTLSKAHFFVRHKTSSRST